ncbi:PQQ-dependent sugar dehydrogenase [Rivibacter subsaxonicus]|uniref:Glucose/arabinose dehydrogenase n=1 Tax=Rivibacter subsaxonicus TaxID=457575 RepID=A0A4Q7W0A9_9BURK|nr:PQQ-dependent sugar dehydrogenase [Rivibacter subsaxonicus]RZU02520.1 glucose/arabinose dehydrogenase [Rivibacter subsaxonicus]
MIQRRHLLLATPALLARPAGAQNMAAATAEGRIVTTPLARGLANPWAVAVLPEGRLLVTERPGRMRIVAADGTLSAPLRGLPPVVVRGQGGLLDVVLAPDFASSGLVFWSYAEAAADGGGANSTAVARGRLDVAGLALNEVRVIFRQRPKFDSGAHFGCRLVFDREGRLFVTLGDRFVRSEDAQLLDNDHGKVLRISPDGGVPDGNPFVGKAGAQPELWSFGHRNVQGAALHPVTGELWTHEHGPQGGDELNVDLAGRNYGWPLITWGRQYVTGLKIGEGSTRADIEPAVQTWVPSIAPSGMAFLAGKRYGAPPTGANASVFIGALKAQALVRLDLDGRRVLRETRYPVGARVRDVRQAPDGHLLLLTDDGNDGRVLRVDRLD